MDEGKMLVQRIERVGNEKPKWQPVWNELHTERKEKQ